MTSPASPTWAVISQQETMDQGPGGSYVQGVKVTFRTSTGQVGSVFVPQESYTADEVRRRVDQKAATVLAVADLQG